MIDRYIFRAKRKDNNEWVTGYYVFQRKCSGVFGQMISELDFDRHLIIDLRGNSHEVIPETVVRCTGLKDKNGKLMFEGDIVHFKTPAYHYKNCRIKYQAFYARYCAIDNKGYEYPMDKAFEYEVIGNIYDNPELLEVER